MYIMYDQYRYHTYWGSDIKSWKKKGNNKERGGGEEEDKWKGRGEIGDIEKGQRDQREEVP